jgi:hypothetical protein
LLLARLKALLEKTIDERKELAALAIEHPELCEALVKLAELHRVMESEVKRRREGSLIRCWK